jgi:hypothetical protein
MIKKSYRHWHAAREDFELLNQTATEGQRIRWQEQLDNAMSDRIERVEAMDILSISLEKRGSIDQASTAFAG